MDRATRPSTRPALTAAPWRVGRVITHVASLFALVGCAGSGTSHKGQVGRLDVLLKPDEAPSDARLGRYVQEVGRRLMAGAKALRDDPTWPPRTPRPEDWAVRDVGFCVVDGATPNAFTVGEPYVYATSTLLRSCRTEDQFAGAVAHAYAHLLCHHAPSIVATVANPDDADTVGLAFATIRLTADQERQADELAVALLARGGWAPEAYLEFLSARRPEPGAPAFAARLSNVAERLRSLPPTASDWRQPPVADAKRYAANQALPIGPARAPALATRRATLIVAAFHDCFGGDDAPEQLRARTALQPPLPPKPDDNPWGKGLTGPRQP